MTEVTHTAIPPEFFKDCNMWMPKQDVSAMRETWCHFGCDSHGDSDLINWKVGGGRRRKKGKGLEERVGERERPH